MPYAKTNLHDVADAAAQHGLGEHQEARFPAGELGILGIGLNHLVVKPGRREAFAHRHREAEEVYVVLSGSGRVKLDDELVELAPRDVIRVEPGTVRAFEAGADGLEVLVVGARVEGDSEVIEGFWD